MADFLTGGEQTVGYRYSMGLHLAVAHGPIDAITKILVGDRVAWEGDVTSTTRISIAEPQLFGGDAREGGVVGDVDLEFGDSAQVANDYLEAQLGAPQPGYRGVFGMVWRGVQLTSNNPYIKPIAARVRRVPSGWNDAEARIGDGANPAHIIRECLLDPAWGMGYLASSIDDPSFLSASSTLVSESFGISLIWTQQTEIREFIQQVLDHIGGVLTVSPSTGRFELKLIRDDYTPGNLPLFDESSVVELESYQRAGWGEVVNEITVVYTAPESGEDATITVQDLGNMTFQGPVTETRRYPGIADRDLAARVAMRDLTTVSRPLAKVDLVLNRDAWDLSPGDPFRFSWPDLGILEQVLRAVNVNAGTLADGTIRVQAIEDTFAFRDNAYTEPEPIGWTEPATPPTISSPRKLLESSYWDLSQRVTQEVLDALVGTEAYLQTIAGRLDGLSLAYIIHSRLTGSGTAWGDATRRTAVDHAGYCALDPAENPTPPRPELVSTFAYTAEVDISRATVGRYVYIDDGTNPIEAAKLLSINTSTKQIGLERGLLDTVPRNHDAGARIWFADGYTGSDLLEYADSDSVDVRMQTRSTTGELDVADAPTDVVVLDRRLDRPYPPGNVKVDGAAYPLTFTGPLELTWSHRDRLSQTVDYPNQSDGDIGPEPGTTYTVRIYGETGALQNTFSGIAGTSHTYTVAEDIADNGLGRASRSLTFELESVRGGLVSWQAHRVRVFRDESDGYGLQYGLSYGGVP